MKPATYLESTIALVKTIEESFLVLSERLKKIRDDKLYESSYDNFEEFLEEAKVSPATASKMIQIYEKFILELGFSNEEVVESGGWSLLYSIIPFCKNKTQAKEWMGKTKILPRHELEVAIREERTGVDSYKCEHEMQEVCFKQCKVCGLRTK